MSLPADGALGRDGLTEQEAFLAMTEFLWQYARRAGDDLITLLGDIELEADGQPTDLASWGDWLECVQHVKAGLPPRRESS
jgi:hypothetical protein